MADTNDTIEGLLAEFRGYAAGMPPSYHVTMSWADFRRMLDRLEAAHRRERGDCAKLREACANIAEYARSAMCHTTNTHVLGYLDQIEGWAKAALAAPPRNCDRPECATTKAAQDVWRKEDGGKTAYYEWLFATYKEGGNDGR